jgi:hypothetical protein
LEGIHYKKDKIFGFAKYLKQSEVKLRDLIVIVAPTYYLITSAEVVYLRILLQIILKVFILLQKELHFNQQIFNGIWEFFIKLKKKINLKKSSTQTNEPPSTTK